MISVATNTNNEVIKILGKKGFIIMFTILSIELVTRFRLRPYTNIEGFVKLSIQ